MCGAVHIVTGFVVEKLEPKTVKDTPFPSSSGGWIPVLFWSFGVYLRAAYESWECDRVFFNVCFMLIRNSTPINTALKLKKKKRITLYRELFTRFPNFQLIANLIPQNCFVQSQPCHHMRSYLLRDAVTLSTGTGFLRHLTYSIHGPGFLAGDT